MKDDDETPRSVLGDDLWRVLGAADPPPMSSDFDARLRARLAEEEGREALGDEVWDALGAAPVPPAPDWPDRAPRPRRAAGPSWQTWAAVAMAAGLTFVAVPALRGPTPEPPDDLALVRDLELAENLDLLASADFDVLLAWDGEAP